jgi:hypothetical protein
MRFPLSTHMQGVSRLWENIRKNQQDIFKLSGFTYQTNSNSFLRHVNIVSLDTTPVFYDLYKFLGITYANEAQEPASAYEYDADSNSWVFILPTVGFAVPEGATPESQTEGATPWEYQTTIAIVKSSIDFPKMPDWGIDGAKLISYIANLNGTPVENIKVVLQSSGQNMDEISVDFNNFHRWIALEEGYRLEYYAIYPITNTQAVITSNLYIYNSKNTYYGQ